MRVMELKATVAFVTNDPELAAAVLALANHGSQKKYVFKYFGCNCRMDGAMQQC